MEWFDTAQCTVVWRTGPCSLSHIVMSSLLLATVLSVCTVGSTLPSGLVSANIGTRSYRCSLCNLPPISSHMLQCSSAHTLSCLFMYCSFASTGRADMMCSTQSAFVVCLPPLLLLLLLFICTNCGSVELRSLQCGGFRHVYQFS